MKTPTPAAPLPDTQPDILRPLPIRITKRQYARLVAHRQIDSLAIQEHIRRAIDFYLDDLDLKRPNERVATNGAPGVASQKSPPAAPAAAAAKAPSSKLVFR